MTQQAPIDWKAAQDAYRQALRPFARAETQQEQARRGLRQSFDLGEEVITPQTLIIRHLAKNPNSTIQDLMPVTGLSRASVRRNLCDMQEQGLVRCTKRERKFTRGACMVTHWRLA